MPTKVELQEELDTIWTTLATELNVEEITTKEGFITYVKKLQDKNAELLTDNVRLLSLVEGHQQYLRMTDR
jgi:hypothetical protein|tara:strand:+ start:887 stop:1099 length:213 start_codon:yes stop_codon:yes gene_type:complete